MQDGTRPGPWRSPIGITLIGFALVAAFYVLREHTEHALGALPYLLLVACPLMHLFMHHDHGSHGPARAAPPDRPAALDRASGAG